ncbi:MAG: histidine phosphatase family protein [Alphaproteobacteria bacterium]|nr:histidine phosphatase family protein [Alphaproteobacteria bacterium]MBL7099261.1 histidine phosphatase family protein [Alphaproteobacteria bacterium]
MTLALKPGLTLYFARHGQTEANLHKQFSGMKDTPLTPLGREQAKEVGDILAETLGLQPMTVDFVCSPLQRAKTTMSIVREVLGLPHDGFRTDPRLQEIDLGIWDQLTDAEARALDPAFFERRTNDKWNVRIPEGESYADVAKRIESFCHDIARDTFIVSHGATTRILRGLFAGLSAQQMSALDEPQGVVFCARGNVVTRLDPDA